MYKCKYCERECKNLNSLKQHEIRCKENPNKIDISNSCINIINYNKRILDGDKNVTPKRNQYTKAEYYGLEKPIVSDITRKKLSISGKNQIWDDCRRKKLSERMIQAVIDNPESYSSSNINGRIKKRVYNDQIFDSNWEVIVAKFLDKNNIKWIRPLNGFEYIWNNSMHIYYPDFYLTDYNLYIEVKGYIRDKDLFKWKAVPNLIILKKEEINNIIKEKYNIESLLNFKVL